MTGGETALVRAAHRQCAENSTQPGDSGREAHSVNDEIDWAGLHRTTRTRPTVTTFGWRAKVWITLPPFAMVGFWAYAGVFNNGAAALGFGVPLLWAASWWLKQVWVAGRDPDVQVRTDPANRPAEARIAEVGRRLHPGLAYLHDDGRAHGAHGARGPDCP